MRVGRNHLTYCLNIHPGESLADVRSAITEYASRVKATVAEAQEFGVGLRLSAEAAAELMPEIGRRSQRLDDLRGLLNESGMYTFTVNGFPYGPFHGTPVKEMVYQPDWSTSERVEYTLRLAHIMAALAPQDVDPSISTVPVCYGKELPDTAVDNILRTARELELLRRDSGRRVVLAFEPEPDCYLEMTSEVIAFWRLLRDAGGSELDHIGVCLDTCHAATNFEDPAESLRLFRDHGVPVAKIQISSSLAVPSRADARSLLRPYDESTYLHQTRIRTADGVVRYADLPMALASSDVGEWRVHFHVPLDFSFEGAGGIQGTSSLLTSDFFADAADCCDHLEVETYSFDVMPNASERDVVDSVASELAWVLERINT